MNGTEVTDLLGSSIDISDESSTNQTEDCFVVNETSPKGKVQLRRSSRTIKHKSYDEGSHDDNVISDEESDPEEVCYKNPLKVVPISIPYKGMKFNTLKRNQQLLNNESSQLSNIFKNYSCQKVKNFLPGQNRNKRSDLLIKSSQANSKSTSTILPSLTDDMFVVEAPSFVVPYLYEKPPEKQLKEYIDSVGAVIDQQNAKDKQHVHELEYKTNKESEQSNIRQESSQNVSEQERNKKTTRDNDKTSWDVDSCSTSENECNYTKLREQVKFVNSNKFKKNGENNSKNNNKKFKYFDSSLGNFFINIGLNLVQEHTQKELLKMEIRKLRKQKKLGLYTKECELSISSLKKNLEKTRKNNNSLTLNQKKCKLCSFRSESELVLNDHMETPHIRNNVYICNLCKFEVKSPHEILTHMDTIHSVKAKLERALSTHQCPNCPYEDNSKGKLVRHSQSCAKRFKPEFNLCPPIDWEPPAIIPESNVNNGLSKIVGQTNSFKPLTHQKTPPESSLTMGNFVICEICDGYIKNLEQLRNHMQWIHKVRIHPKMIYNKPPLNCQKCQFRFFTDQGLERHLLGTHGLVTNSIQEAANRGKDAGRCPVCGRVYPSRLLNHVAKDHSLTLKPAHLSYKCTVCTATFSMYKLFENHVYSAHSGVAKRVIHNKLSPVPVKKVQM